MWTGISLARVAGLGRRGGIRQGDGAQLLAADFVVSAVKVAVKSAHLNFRVSYLVVKIVGAHVLVAIDRTDRRGARWRVAILYQRLHCRVGAESQHKDADAGVEKSTHSRGKVELLAAITQREDEVRNYQASGMTKAPINAETESAKRTVCRQASESTDVIRAG